MTKHPKIPKPSKVTYLMHLADWITNSCFYWSHLLRKFLCLSSFVVDGCSWFSAPLGSCLPVSPLYQVLVPLGLCGLVWRLLFFCSLLYIVSLEDTIPCLYRPLSNTDLYCSTIISWQDQLRQMPVEVSTVPILLLMKMSVRNEDFSLYLLACRRLVTTAFHTIQYD